MRPQEKDYASQVAYTRDLEVYCDSMTTERDECSAEAFVWKSRYEFSCGERKKLLSDNAGLVKNQESNTAAFLAMREERDAIIDAIKSALESLNDGPDNYIQEAIEALKKACVK